ncbi:hypothetical protein V6N13_004850 [Hibiscus sabdariffa]|uniref:Uncharacterized protein n=1 Tax=Hibiscus sabdariffa TaxID=183260 RepID=A0ABR2RZZ9_9ROSI
MLKLMQRKALELLIEVEKGDGSSGVGFSSSTNGEDGSSGLGSRGTRIKKKLDSPIELEVEDVSYQHVGHVGVRGSDEETHFNVRIVSKEFEGKSLVKRHRLIYCLLDKKLQTGLHTLSIVVKTSSEVEAK